MKICVFGSKKSTIVLLNYLFKKNIKVNSLVLLDPCKFKSIKISGHIDNINEIAKSLGIKVYNVKKYSLKSVYDINFFRKNSFDLGLCTNWQRIIPKNILKCFKHGIFGWHGSGFKFPNGRGRSPINWSLRLGLNCIYHNCFKYGEIFDNGEIYETIKFQIKNNDYVDDLQKKAINHICKSAEKLIKDISSNKLKLYKQIDYPFISFPSLNDKSGQIYTNLLSVNQARNIIRSCSNPFPGAYVKLTNKNIKVRIWKADILKKVSQKNIISKGHIFFCKKEILIGFYNGILRSTKYETNPKNFRKSDRIKKFKCV